MSDLNKLIKELRTKTGAGFLDCKKSLKKIIMILINQ